MQPDEESLSEFRKLYLEQYQVELSDQVAFEMGSRLMAMVKAVYGNNLPTTADMAKLTSGYPKINNSIAFR